MSYLFLSPEPKFCLGQFLNPTPILDPSNFIMYLMTDLERSLRGIEILGKLYFTILAQTWK